MRVFLEKFIDAFRSLLKVILQKSGSDDAVDTPKEPAKNKKTWCELSFSERVQFMALVVAMLTLLVGVLTFWWMINHS